MAFSEQRDLADGKDEGPRGEIEQRGAFQTALPEAYLIHYAFSPYVYAQSQVCQTQQNTLQRAALLTVGIIHHGRCVPRIAKHYENNIVDN